MGGRTLVAGLRIAALSMLLAVSGSVCHGSVVARDSFRFCGGTQLQAIVLEMLPGNATSVCDLRPLELFEEAWSLASAGFGVFPIARTPATLDARRPIPRRFVVSNPEPGSLLIWTSLGLTWVGKRWWRRAKSKSSSTARQSRARGTGSRIKRSWPEHVRFAILDMIEQGRSNRGGNA